MLLLIYYIFNPSILNSDIDGVFLVSQGNRIKQYEAINEQILAMLPEICEVVIVINLFLSTISRIRNAPKN